MSIDFDIYVNINPLLKEILEKAIIDGLNKAVNIVEKQAIKDCPQDTPYMVFQIKSEVDENDFKAEVSVNTNYAMYVEYADGTMFRKKNPRKRGKIPFLRPALYDNRDKIVNIMNNEIKKAIK